MLKSTKVWAVVSLGLGAVLGYAAASSTKGSASGVSANTNLSVPTSLNSGCVDGQNGQCCKPEAHAQQAIVMSYPTQSASPERDPQAAPRKPGAGSDPAGDKSSKVVIGEDDRVTDDTADPTAADKLDDVVLPDDL